MGTSSHGEAAVRQSEERFRQMADTIPEVIWITSLEPERVLYTSPSFERIWGLKVEELYRNPRLWTETIHPEDRDRVVGLFSEWIAGAEVAYAIDIGAFDAQVVNRRCQSHRLEYQS